MEHGQRGRKRPQLRTLLRLDQVLRSVTPGAVRAGLLPRGLQHRHRLPDVLELRPMREIPRRRSRETAYPMRIRSRHGQFAGRIQGVLGHDTSRTEISGRVYLGLRRPGPRMAQPRREADLPLRRRLQRRRRLRQHLLLQRRTGRRPHVASPRLRSEAPAPADPHHGPRFGKRHRERL